LNNHPVLAFPDMSLPFILSADASQVGLEAVLSKIQDGIERPIAYASQQIIKSERSYSASEVEALAVVWATKYFRCYLYGKKFLVRTDHSGLRYLLKFTDNNMRLMRWSLRLAEFDFDIEHMPGTKMGRVDALSQHIAAVSEKVPLTEERFLQEQKQDEFCKDQRGKSHTRKTEFCLDEDGVLCRRQEGRDDQIVVPATLVMEVIRTNHDSVFTTHPGRKRTLDLIAVRYWWPRMRQEVEKYVSKCDKCQTEPFQVTSMDITEPYSLTLRTTNICLPKKKPTNAQRVLFSSIITHSYMFRPCWVIFREKPSVVVTVGCTIQLSENVLLTVHCTVNSL
jgi:hypothetical protein